MELRIASAHDLADEGSRMVVPFRNAEIGVLRAKGQLRAFLNLCPHQGGPVCEGMLINRVEEVLGDDKTYKGMRFTDDLNLVCPWHGWEFDIETGRCAGDGKHGLRTFPVVERNGEVFVVTG